MGFVVGHLIVDLNVWWWYRRCAPALGMCTWRLTREGCCAVEEANAGVEAVARKIPGFDLDLLQHYCHVPVTRGGGWLV